MIHAQVLLGRDALQSVFVPYFGLVWAEDLANNISAYLPYRLATEEPRELIAASLTHWIAKRGMTWTKGHARVLIQANALPAELVASSTAELAVLFVASDAATAWKRATKEKTCTD